MLLFCCFFRWSPVFLRKDGRFKKFGRKTPQGVTHVYDCRVITSEYLIRNIDRAFAAYAEPWNRNLPFSDFCELILPYWCNVFRSMWRMPVSRFPPPVTSVVLSCYTGFPQMAYDYIRSSGMPPEEVEELLETMKEFLGESLFVSQIKV